MNQLETAQYILDEFVEPHGNLIATEVSFPPETLTAIIHTENKPIKVTGLFAQKLKTANQE